jgi:D-alanyl-D-alanine carboxypeptidase
MTRHRPAPPRRLSWILAVALLLASAAIAAASMPAPVLAGPVATGSAAPAVPGVGTEVDAADVPACTVADDPAPFRATSQWRSTLVDTQYRLQRRYVPPHLVSTAGAGLNGGSYVRRLVRDDLRAMVRAARRAGITLHVNSAYRSYRDQKRLYEAMVARLGPEKAARRAARPGHSEHQLGTALDLANTAGAYTWLRDHGWRYGFLVSYPKGARSISCYRYEPWHVRYYGRERAATIRGSGLVPRAWLWIHAFGGTG